MEGESFYHEDADEHSASAAYAQRFSGPAGEWLLKRQSQIVLDFTKDRKGALVLDVGGGHGQIACPLSRAGFRVHCLGSSEKALIQVRDLAAAGQCQASVGELLNLPFPSASFDIVTCFRLLPHCRGWQRLIQELCRVARSQVIVDYPLVWSANALTPLLFGLKKGLEGNTREYTLFEQHQVEAEFEASAFGLFAARKEFFWPMVLHRIIKSPVISGALEAVPEICGLTALLGSPVIAAYHKRAAVLVESVPTTLVREVCA